MLSRNNHHTQAIDYKERVINKIQSTEIICAKEFELEGVQAPECHETNLGEVQDKSFPRVSMDNPAVNCNKWHQRHVPEEILSSHYFVECNESPGLEYDGKENVVVETETGHDYYAPLWNKHEKRH